MSTTPLKVEVVILEGDTETSTMNMLVQVIDHMTAMHSLTAAERHRIANWFACRYGPQDTGA